MRARKPAKAALVRAGGDTRASSRQAKVATFRFYEELNDFLPRARRKRSFTCLLDRRAAVKDMIEALGVPHTEVELIVVNGESVDFSYIVEAGDRIAVYPVFESIDITPLVRVRPRPLRVMRFVVDANLGKLARLLRLLGFDTWYRSDYQDAELAQLARQGARILLTRDVGLLKRSHVTHGYYVRQSLPMQQAQGVVARFDLWGAARPFSRCTRCNGLVEPVPADHVQARLSDRVRASCDAFWRCSGCGQVYWRGGHYRRMRQIVATVLRKPLAETV